MRWTLAWTVIALGTAVTATGCAVLGLRSQPTGTAGVGGRIEERATSFAGIAIGDQVLAVKRRFGRPEPADRRREPVTPANATTATASTAAW